MGITIRQQREKWNLSIDNEVWEFEDRETMERHLKVILDIKENKGRVKF